MPMLKLYNTLTRQKEVLEPLQPGKVGLYVCGMTVYDYCHIGHARMLAAFDIIQRWLRVRGFDVTYVRNITDIDDKIIRRAVENGETLSSLTGRFIQAMHEDEAALGIQRPDIEPRATDYVPQMLDLIGLLEQNGLAYRADSGDTLFRVRRFPGYGRLAGKSLDDLRAGERVAVAADKEDPFDFVLWKAAKPEEPAEACWHSPFGNGRPGWHIECSAMSTQLLGRQFDIHGGGADLQFPHHENELAQSDGAFFLNDPERKSFVRYWMHNGFVQIDGEKMSKSLGNFFTIRDVLDSFDGEVIRFFIVRSHYRSQVNYSDAALEDARETLLRLYNALPAEAPAIDTLKPGRHEDIDWNDPRARRFAEAMDDDFNTPVAIAVLFELAGEVNRTGDAATARLYRALASVLGLLGKAPADVRRTGLRGSGAASGALDDAAIDALVAQRLAARKEKRFADADAIRQQLADAGITLEDGPGGTTWRR
ncbi:MAG: cysteine--tRNA ligase [Lautropia sp.]|nr:cysteine--tRNA ligase [Lautropia sp.]